MELNILNISLGNKSPTVITFALGFAVSAFFNWLRSKSTKEGKSINRNAQNKTDAGDGFYQRFNFYAPPRLRNAIAEFYKKHSTNTSTQEKFFKSISANLDVDDKSGKLVVKLRWYDYPIALLLVIITSLTLFYAAKIVLNFSQLQPFSGPLLIFFLLLFFYYCSMGWPYINILRMKKMTGQGWRDITATD